MYNKTDLIKVLAVLGVIAFIFMLPLIIGLVITWLIIWISNGLFNYDLHDKFWYIYILIVIIIPIIRGSFFRVTINK